MTCRDGQRTIYAPDPGEAATSRNPPRISSITDAEGAEIFRVDSSMSAPRSIYAPDPEYSERARKAKKQGTAFLWVIVTSEGRVGGIRIARSTGYDLDQKAIDAVCQWKFQPAVKDDKPVAVLIDVAVSFRLY